VRRWRLPVAYGAMGNRLLRWIYVLDMVSLAIALGVASLIVFDTHLPWAATTTSSVWPFLAMLFAGATLGSYLSARAWAKAAPRPTYGRALAIVAFAAAFTAVGLVLTRVYWSRPMLALSLAAWLGLMFAHRAVLRRRPWSEPMVIITAEKQLAEDIRNTEHAEVLAVLEPGEEPPSEPMAEGVSVVVDLRAVLSEEMARYVSSASIAGYRVRSFSEAYEEHTGRLPMVHLAEGWELSQPVARSSYAPAKRGIDLLLTVLTAPLWLLIGAIVWVAVRLDTPGAGLYHQERVGRNDRLFTLHKFRTMQEDAEEDGPRFAEPGDPRITRVGRFLRQSRLDEIPQLWNVIRGDLSIVGPRPERPVFVEEYERAIPFYGSRHLIRPGVTGWAQVNYGYADDEADAVEKLTYDLYYVKHSSVWVDLHILGMSIWTVLSGFGAR
jgi:exopolysaccharide biosynthesis polyprenyl glycosylphosphotransferase